MVNVVEPVLPPPPLLLSLLSSPQAATPNDSAASRQPEAARLRTRNVSPPQGIGSGEGGILCSPWDGAQWSTEWTTIWWSDLTATGGDCRAGTATACGPSRRPAR